MRLAIILWFAAAVAAGPEFTTLDRGGFRLLYLPESERAVQDLLPTLERERARVSESLGIPPPELITVVYAPDQARFLAWQGGAPAWASGMAYPSRGLIYLRPLTGTEVRASSMRAVAAHELSHVLLYHKLNGHSCPTWLDEGMAVFWSLEPLYARVERLYPIGLTGRSISFRDLEGGFPSDAGSASTAYAQSGDFIRFLYYEYGQDAVNHYLDLLSQGQDPDVALKTAFPGTLFDLEMKWLKSVRWTYGWIPALSGGALLWFLIAALAIVAIFKKRSRSRARLRAMAAEERFFFGDEPAPSNRPPDDPDPFEDDDADDYEDDDEPPFRGLH